LLGDMGLHSAGMWTSHTKNCCQ